jgi:uncharacterized phage protein gp47/JayE
MAYGITDQGFVKKRLIDAKTDLETKFKAAFGQGINLQPGSNWSTLIGLIAGDISDLWEALEAAYNASYKDSATGVNLDNVLALVRVKRLEATKSLQQGLLLFGVAGTTIPAGTKVGVVGNDQAVFETSSDVLLVAGTDEVQHIAFGAVPTSGNWTIQFYDQVSATLAYNANAAAIQTALNNMSKLAGCTVTGDYTSGFNVTFSGACGKINHPLLQTNTNTLLATATPVVVTFSQTTPGVPQGTTDALCTVYGPVSAPAYSMTTIIQPVVGLTGVLNITDTVVGRDAESDPAYRLRAAADQASTGKATVDAIRANLLALTGVTQVTVFENVTDSVDGNGLPAHSFRAYVQGGANQDILDTVWKNKPTGIYPDGSVVGTVVDSQGITQSVRFSRPTQVPLYISLTVTRDLSAFPADGTGQIQTALADYVNALEIGADVIVYPKLISTLNNISGINDIVIRIGTAPSPTLDDNIVIGVNEVARVIDQAADIAVTLA